MSNPLFPCPRCQRHVRVSSEACPFCAAPLPESPYVVPSAGAVTLSRAALFAFATTVAACTQNRVEPTPSAVATIYGGPPAVPAPPATPVTQTDQTGAVAAIYGAPAMMLTNDAGTGTDAAADVASDVADASVPDAARRRDSGMMMIRYGAPPADFV